jgi:hypothetical protein
MGGIGSLPALVPMAVGDGKRRAAARAGADEEDDKVPVANAADAADADEAPAEDTAVDCGTDKVAVLARRDTPSTMNLISQ